MLGFVFGGYGSTRGVKASRCTRRTVCSVSVAEQVDGKFSYTKDDNWRGFYANTGIWEGNVTTYDEDGKEVVRVPNSLFIFPEGTGEREDSGEGPRSVWVQLQRPEMRPVTQFWSFRDNLVARGLMMGPEGDMDSASPSVDSDRGGNFEQMITGWDDANGYYGRVRVVHTAYKEGGEFREWTVFRERAAPDTLPQFFSEIPTMRHPAPEVASTDHPWLSHKENSSPLVFELLAGEWRGTKLTIRPGDGAAERQSYTAKVSVTDRKLRCDYESEHFKGGTLSGRFTSDRSIQFGFGYVLRDLGGGVTVLTPQALEDEEGDFFIECAWMIGNERRRISRQYENGEWVATSFSTEEKVA